MRAMHAGQHHQPDPGTERCAALGAVRRVCLLALEQREHVAADVCLRRVRLAQVAAQPRERERLPAGPAHQHPRDRKAEQARKPLQPDVVVQSSLTRGRSEIERILAGQQALRLTTQDRCHLGVVEPDLVGVAGDHRRDHERREVGQVGRVQQVTRRDQRDQRGDVGRVPPARVDEQVRITGDLAPEPVEVADRTVGEHDPCVRIPRREPRGIAAERRDPAPGMDQNRQPALVREREDRFDVGLGQLEALRPGMQLDSLRTGLEAAARLVQRLLAGIKSA